MSRARMAVLIAALCPGLALAGSDLLRAPISARQLGNGQLYGNYDVFKAFVNPALLSNQPQTWEFGFSERNLYGGAENIASLAAGYGSVQTDTGVFGAAVLLTGALVSAFDETDIYGNSLGSIAPSIMRIGLAGLYQWNFVSLGAGLNFNNESIATPGAAGAVSTNQVKVDIGTSITLGKLDLGVVYHITPQDVAGLDFGFAFVHRAEGIFRSFGVDYDLPFSLPVPSGSSGSTGTTTPGATTPDTVDGYAGTLSGGVTLRPYHDIEARIGAVGWLTDGGVGARLGFTVPWKAWGFDYGLTIPVYGVVTGAGWEHALGVTYRLGSERKMPEGPRFMLGEKERTMAVANFDPQNVSAGDAAVISDMIRNQLIKEGSFNIVEKANMDKVLGEQAFQQTGCTTQECAVKLGKVLNVKYLVVGSFGKALDQYVLSMRVIDVETAKAVYSDEAYGKNLPEVRDGITTMAGNLTKAVTGKK